MNQNPAQNQLSPKDRLWQKIKSGKGVETDFYTYSFVVASLAAAASATSTISVQANAAFVIVKLAVMADLAGALQTDSSRVIPLVNVSINDSGSGRNLQNTPVPLGNIAGSAQLPFVMPQQRILMPSSSVQALFTNYSAASTYLNLTLTLIGYQVFEY